MPRGSRERVFAVLSVAVPLAVFLALAAAASRGGELGSESALADLLDRLLPVSSEEIHVDPYLQAITIAVAAATAGLAAALVVRGDLRSGLFLVTATGGTLLLSTVTKAIVQRPAIEGPAGEYSFPSGSAAWSMATVVAIALLVRPGRGRRLLLFAGAVFVLSFSATIVFEEWHYPSDVLGAWALALGWVAFLWCGPFRRPRGWPARVVSRRTVA